MTDEIEEALRRELQAQWVPFDEARAEDMVRAAADAGLAGTQRAWVAPLAAAAAVVVVGGGVALATSGGGNSGATGPGGPGVGPSTGSNNYVVGPCSPVGSGGVTVGTAYPASEVPTGSIDGSVMPGIYTTVNQPATADLPPPPESATATAVEVPPTVAGSPTEIPVSAPASASDLPTSVGSDGTISIERSGSVVLCEVGPAGATIGSDGCTTHRNAEICVSTGDCSTTKDASTSPDNTVVCVGEGTLEPLPTEPPTASGSGRPVIDNICNLGDTCGPTETPSSSADDTFTIDTQVAPGETKTVEGPTIPAGQKLVVTRFDFRNPAADTGTFTVHGDVQHRITLHMINYRMNDFHFEDEPITYDADHPLSITVDCANTADACTPYVDVTGQLVPAN